MMSGDLAGLFKADLAFRFFDFSALYPTLQGSSLNAQGVGGGFNAGGFFHGATIRAEMSRLGKLAQVLCGQLTRQAGLYEQNRKRTARCRKAKQVRSDHLAVVSGRRNSSPPH